MENEEINNVVDLDAYRYHKTVVLGLPLISVTETAADWVKYRKKKAIRLERKEHNKKVKEKYLDKKKVD